jgi:hypothetical protein
MKFLSSLVALALVGCGIFGTPSAQSGQCFAYCLDVPVNGQTIAFCYGSQAEQVAALAQLQAAGVQATVRK